MNTYSSDQSRFEGSLRELIRAHVVPGVKVKWVGAMVPWSAYGTGGNAQAYYAPEAAERLRPGRDAASAASTDPGDAAE